MSLPSPSLPGRASLNPDLRQTGEATNNIVSISDHSPGKASIKSPGYTPATAGVSDATSLYSTNRSSGVAMDTPTHREIDAKPEAAEARAETRFVTLSGKIDRLIDIITTMTTETVKSNDLIRVEMQAIKVDNKFTRTSIIVAIIASVLAGIGASWVAQGNMLASFQAGVALHEATEPPVPLPKATPAPPSH